MTSTAVSFWFPVLYTVAIAVLFGAYIKWNRVKQRVAAHDAATDGYFPPHHAKILYNELAEMHSPDDHNGLKLLSSSLMKRAIADVQLIYKIRDEKPPLQQMVRQGLMGEELLEKLERAEAELDVEVREVMEEAELYKEGWGKTIFPEATQLMQFQMQREQQIEAQRLQQEQAALRAAEERLVKEANNGDDEGEEDDSGPPSSQVIEDNTNLPDETDEQRRQRIAEELLKEEEEEKKRASKKGGKGAKSKKKGGK
ncbi:Pre protein translocase subunit Sec66-domain-containing protein [Phlyctochytrium arcticum]|nr:Pre protein translocase subunit Sec66-domain-containing protein [Phlyctochytrium arcticum]